MKDKSTLTYLFVVALTMFISSSSIAQVESKEKVNEKLNQIKGDISKIIIQTEDGETTFEGDDAIFLFDKLKSKRLMKLENRIGSNMNIWIDDKDSSNLVKKVIEFDGDPSFFFFDDKDSIYDIMIEEESNSDSLTKELKVEEIDGKLTIKLKTIEDGKEKIETFEGDEAEEKLKEMKKVKIKRIGDKNKFFIKKKHDQGMKWTDDDDHVIILDSKDDLDEKTIKVNVENEDGNLKAIVEEKDGDETKITEYKGDEANDFLKNHGNENIFVQKLDDNDLKIIVTKAKSKGDKSEVFTWIEKEVDDMATKIVKYKEEDGEPVLTITTFDDEGEEYVETFEGDEAKSKLKELKKEMKIEGVDSSGSKFIIKKKK